MKIQCDVCNSEEASVFCSADEAALCDACDHRVHHANKLAGKHHRFSLLHPSSKDSPRCDICQERRAFLFCQEDRALLCRECDLPIHTANEHTQKHNRFLLTGVKLSASSTLYSTTTTSSTDDCDASVASEITNPQPLSVSSEILPNEPSIEKTTLTKVNGRSGREEGSTSSIAEYLIDILPGWHVEEFLDPSSAPHGFCKTYDHLLPFLEDDVKSNLSSFYSEDLAIWVPQAPPPQYPPHLGKQIGFKESKEGTNLKVGRKWSDDGFRVPQISPPSAKRCRPF